MVPQLILIPSSPIDSSEYWRTTQSICPRSPRLPLHALSHRSLRCMFGPTGSGLQELRLERCPKRWRLRAKADKKGDSTEQKLVLFCWDGESSHVFCGLWMYPWILGLIQDFGFNTEVCFWQDCPKDLDWLDCLASCECDLWSADFLVPHLNECFFRSMIDMISYSENGIFPIVNSGISCCQTRFPNGNLSW